MTSAAVLRMNTDNPSSRSRMSVSGSRKSILAGIKADYGGSPVASNVSPDDASDHAHPIPISNTDAFLRSRNASDNASLKPQSVRGRASRSGSIASRKDGRNGIGGMPASPEVAPLTATVVQVATRSQLRTVKKATSHQQSLVPTADPEASLLQVWGSRKAIRTFHNEVLTQDRSTHVEGRPATALSTSFATALELLRRPTSQLQSLLNPLRLRLAEVEEAGCVVSARLRAR